MSGPKKTPPQPITPKFTQSAANNPKPAAQKSVAPTTPPHQERDRLIGTRKKDLPTPAPKPKGPGGYAQATSDREAGKQKWQKMDEREKKIRNLNGEIDTKNKVDAKKGTLKQEFERSTKKSTLQKEFQRSAKNSSLKKEFNRSTKKDSLSKTFNRSR